MIPRTFPSIIEALQTKMVVYVLPSITGLTAWIDYIPVKGVTTESNALANTYALDGYQVVKTIESLTGQQAWLDYIPVFESAAYNKPWSTDAGGYIPAGGLFSVASLFAAGEQGTWYDPSDLTTLFQDSAGTTPVTAVQQPVGLMLDKSKGLVLGPELVTTYSSGGAYGNWSGITLSGTTLTSVGVPNNGYTARIAVTTGRTYQVKLPATLIPSAGTWEITVNWSANGTSFSGIVRVVPISTTSFFFVPPATAVSCEVTITRTAASGVGVSDSVGPFTGFSVKELPGNHAFQTTSASRPVLSARYNLLTKTEQFDDAVWAYLIATSVSPNTTLSPIGTLTADTASINATTPIVRQLVSNTVSGVSYTLSAWVKASTASNIRLTVNNTLSWTGAASQKIALTNEWQFVTLTWLSNSTVAYFILGAVNSTGANDATCYGNTFIWGADLRVSNDALGQPAYQRVNTATDYDTVGFKPYLAFDGVDDSLVTNSIDFTATDKMTVFAGVRKLSDDTDRCIVELSPVVDLNNGSFGIFAPSRLSGLYAGKYVGALQGTQTSISELTTYSAPTTNTLSAQYDIAGTSIATESIYRINAGSPIESTNGIQAGTGNFGNYSLYIGRRNNVSLPFNGRIYSLIVRGAASTTAQITSTETYVNQKTGAY